ncbi:MAG: aminodeoxychorismate/anthranilate synthase component II [Candidatus Omnitrophica bacterium]|nr:aminodeoxychorismate/anthranilate synthase component II [Candidatus Omnitrophota bacterium]
MYLLIDNYDSFTYNLFQIFAKEGAEVLVRRNDQITLKEIRTLKPEKIIISPGPRTPADAGISNDIIKRLYAHIPILGICLGHQCIVACFGGRIRRIRKILHGKTSAIIHNNTGILKDVPNPFEGARYHSLETVDIPSSLEVIAATSDGVVMAVKHKKTPVFGLQFHPESFLTESGEKIIENFIKL